MSKLISKPKALRVTIKDESAPFNTEIENHNLGYINGYNEAYYAWEAYHKQEKDRLDEEIKNLKSMLSQAMSR